MIALMFGIIILLPLLSCLDVGGGFVMFPQLNQLLHHIYLLLLCPQRIQVDTQASQS